MANEEKEKNIEKMKDAQDTMAQAGSLLGAVAGVLGVIISIVSKKK